MTTVGSLCSGYGGLDLAVGGELRWVSDIDRTARAVLAHRYPGVPNHGDLTTFDWTRAAPVDVITAGFPCQPFSVAGKRRGVDDERWLWDDIADVLAIVRPRSVILENVPALLSASGGHAMGRVLNGLSALGYVGRWGVVSAAEVGAPHLRERVFIVAHHRDTDGQNGWILGGAPGERSHSHPLRLRRDDDAAHPEGYGRAARRAGADERPPGPGGQPPSDRGAPAYTEGDEQREPSVTRPESESRNSPDWGRYAPAIRRWEHVIGRPAPAPTVGGRLNPRLVEWMMGLPDGWVTDVPGLARTRQLRDLGNGVVPQQAAHALRLLGGVP